MIYVLKTGQAWAVVGEDGQLVRHRRVRAVHARRDDAREAALRFAELSGDTVSLDDEINPRDGTLGPDPHD